MRTIVRRIPAKTATSYQCAKCRTKYRDKAKALRCETQSTEAKLFKLNDRVMWRELRFCQNRQKHYWMKGRVTKIIGPLLPDFEYNAKWLAGLLTGMHVFMYEVRWVCPLCKETRDSEFYSLELRKLK